MDRNSSWVRPEISSSALTYAVTSSVVEEFAHGHTVSDVLRELVQNEYDAHGSSLSVVFGEDGLYVAGTGDPIDEAGWQRLTVMLGTGRVAGEGRDVARKTNGIGSKMRERGLAAYEESLLPALLDDLRRGIPGNSRRAARVRRRARTALPARCPRCATWR